MFPGLRRPLTLEPIDLEREAPSIERDAIHVRLEPARRCGERAVALVERRGRAIHQRRASPHERRPLVHQRDAALDERGQPLEHAVGERERAGHALGEGAQAIVDAHRSHRITNTRAGPERSAGQTTRAIAYDETVQRIELSATARQRRGEWKQSLPGLVSLFAAIGFFAGIFDADMREVLGDVLAGCAVVAVVSGVLWVVAKRAQSRAFVVGEDDAGPFVRLEGVGERRAPLSYTFGWTRERLEAGIVSGTVAVLFVAMEGAGGPPIVLRKALGAAFSAPRGWEQSPVTFDASHVLLDIEELPRALDAIGAERRPPMAWVRR